MLDEAPAKKPAPGSPAWVMTFADLMSLLLCFFVLLLSFSEMDVSKYKELAGSLQNAFGVQRDIQVKEPPKGINVVAREFSPGRPEPTPMNVIRQMTTSDLNVNLDLGILRRPPTPAPKADHAPDREKALNRSDRDEGLSELQKVELEKAKRLAAKRLEERLVAEQKLLAALARNEGKITIDEKSLEDLIKAKVEAERQRKLEESAQLISNALGGEIKQGSVDVETEGRKIVIRVREKASFGSGQAELKDAFRPLLGRVASILKDSEGKIIVAGHTDNVPINTERFRSNWELSAARAVSVAHEMMRASGIPNHRFLVQGFADTEPMTDNSTAAHRATNRRVEIVLMQGDDIESAGRDSGAGQEKSPAETSDTGSTVDAPLTGAPNPAPPDNSVAPATPPVAVRVGGSPSGSDKTPVPAPAPKNPPTVGVRVGGSQ
ncbi:MAG: OmpA family protein [Thiogranum sp.]|nr:OmpA family protein [Thiogranum sp.]